MVDQNNFEVFEIPSDTTLMMHPDNINLKDETEVLTEKVTVKRKERKNEQPTMIN